MIPIESNDKNVTAMENMTSRNCSEKSAPVHGNEAATAATAEDGPICNLERLEERQEELPIKKLSSRATDRDKDNNGEKITVRATNHHSHKNHHHHHHKRLASFTAPEAFVLRALLVDEPKQQQCEEQPDKYDDNSNKEVGKVLNHEMLLTALPEPPKENVEQQQQQHPPAAHKPAPAHRPSIQWMWKAHAEGVHPKQLLLMKSSTVGADGHGGNHHRSISKASFHSAVSATSENDFDSDASVEYDLSEGSSWDSQEYKSSDYDAWEILKDEYAEDFGFNYSTRGIESVDQWPDSFQILGTSADDKSAQPHVMSPPMMDSLRAFLPDCLEGQNFWLRYSLIRDGACLDTLKRYVRASKYTILAIETPKGEVFGSFTSTPWRNNYGYYGTIPAFVWKLRHSRRTKCASLFERAQRESEVDVYMAGGLHERIQVCRHDILAVGGDEDVPRIESFENLQEALAQGAQYGFAIGLQDDLMRGTTSHCKTFLSPALCGKGVKTETFVVANLEVWSLTPGFDVDTAEKLEMTKFFVEESFRSLNATPSTTSSSSSRKWLTEPMDQESFYRRIGQDTEGQSRREHWNAINAMTGVTDKRKGLGPSPRYS
jgi:hypothetical protein